MVSQCLADEFERRRGKNRYYSMRAFARDVGVSPALLSLIFRGRRMPSLPTAEKIFERIKLPQSQRGYYLSLLSQQLKQNDSHSLVEPREVMDSTTFEMIGTWIHFAVLSLANVEGCRNDPSWIANRLGISVEQATTAMEELLSLDKIEIVGDSFSAKGANVDTGTHSTSVKQRQLMRDFLNMATNSLERDPLIERCFRTLTCALGPERLEPARQLIEEFLDRFETKLCHQKGKRVYTLGVYLFPVEKDDVCEG